MADYHVVSSVQLIDADGDSGSVVIYQSLPDSTTLAELTALIATFAGELEIVVDGQILKGTCSVEFPLTAGKSSPVANCEVQKGALFTWTVDGTIYHPSTFIPTFKPSLFVGDTVNQSGTGVATLIAAFVDHFADKYEHDITAVKSAVKSFRK